MYGTWPDDDQKAFITSSDNISCNFACKCYGILSLACKRDFVTDEGRLYEWVILGDVRMEPSKFFFQSLTPMTRLSSIAMDGSSAAMLDEGGRPAGDESLLLYCCSWDFKLRPAETGRSARVALALALDCQRLHSFIRCPSLYRLCFATSINRTCAISCSNFSEFFQVFPWYSGIRDGTETN